MSHRTQARPVRVSAVARVCRVASQTLNQLETAGLALRTLHASAVDPAIAQARADEVLVALDRAEVERALGACRATRCEDRVREAAEEAFEAAFAEPGDTMWAEGALEALDLRDGLASMQVSLGRMRALGGESGALREAEQHLDELISRTDLALRPELRSFLSLGDARRARRDRLDPEARALAYWYGDRADCDELLRLLAGGRTSDGDHAHRCEACRRDLADSLGPLMAARGIGSEAPRAGVEPRGERVEQ